MCGKIAGSQGKPSVGCANINFLTSGFGAIEIVCLHEDGIEDVAFFSLVVTTMFISFVCKYHL